LLSFPYSESLMALPEFISDFNAIKDRMNRNVWAVPDSASYPQYYRRTYHWQSDGYLSDRSARLYDVSAELQLRGGANIVRRLAVGHVLKNAKDIGSTFKVLELGSGTGRLLKQLNGAAPNADLLGVELSPYYVKAAKRELGESETCRVICANAYTLSESVLSEQHETFDCVVSVFLLHELPAVLRRRVFAECYKLLKPGGVVVFADAVQDVDDLFMSNYLRWLLARFHEPYFYQYLVAPIIDELRAVGFVNETTETAFLAKYFVARKNG
jgi:SAM-dependent methyltransferase